MLPVMQMCKESLNGGIINLKEQDIGRFFDQKILRGHIKFTLGSKWPLEFEKLQLKVFHLL